MRITSETRRRSNAGTWRFEPMVDPDLLEVRSGGGCVSIFGLPFLIAGLFVAQAPLGLIPVQGFEALPWFLYIVFGGAFTLVGGALVFGRSGLILDRRNKRIIRWKGLMKPMKRREVFMGDLKRVSLRKDEGDSDSPTTYPIKLEGDNIDAILVFSPTDYPAARKAAKRVAEFLSLPLEDYTSGVRVLREPERLDESFRDHLRRTKEDLPRIPDPPPDLKTVVREDGDRLTLAIPVQRSRIEVWIRVGALLIFFTLAAYFFLPLLRSLPPPRDLYAIGGIALVFLFMVRRAAAWGGKNETVVTVTPESFRVEQRAGRKSKVTEIPVDDLQDLTLPTEKQILDSIEMPAAQPKLEIPDTGVPRLPDGRPAPRAMVWLLRRMKSPGITAVSDDALAQFGAGLSEQELRYLLALIEKTLSRAR